MNLSENPTRTEFVMTIRPSRKGFSLIELLAVLSLILLMTGLSVVTLSGRNSGRVTASMLQVTGLLEQGRQFAIAQKTYVWMACHEPEDDSDSLLVVLLAANDGVNSVPWNVNSTTDIPSSNLVPISKVFKFEHIRFLEAGVFTASDISRLQGEPMAESAIHSMPIDRPAFKVQYQDKPLTFRRALQFTPSGRVRIGVSPIDFVELGVQALHGGQPDANNLALLRINGITGTSRVYRK